MTKEEGHRLAKEILTLCGVQDQDRLVEVNLHVTTKEFNIEVTHNASGRNGERFRVEDQAIVTYTNKYRLVEV